MISTRAELVVMAEYLYEATRKPNFYSIGTPGTVTVKSKPWAETQRETKLAWLRIATEAVAYVRKQDEIFARMSDWFDYNSPVNRAPERPVP